MKKIIALLAIIALTGCHAQPSKSHVVHVVATGTKFGITENPATQLYELGLTRFQAEVTTVPIMWATNRDGTIYVVIPDVVTRYEVQGKNTTFGGAGLTSTLATGTNAVGTAVGGTVAPINATSQSVILK